MTHEEFMAEFTKRADNRFFNFMHDLNAKSSPDEQREIRKVPVAVLRATFTAGASTGIKIMAEMVKEGKA